MSNQEQEPRHPREVAQELAEAHLEKKLEEDPDFLKRAGTSRQMYLSDMEHQYLLWLPEGRFTGPPDPPRKAKTQTST